MFHHGRHSPLENILPTPVGREEAEQDTFALATCDGDGRCHCFGRFLDGKMPNPK